MNNRGRFFRSNHVRIVSVMVQHHLHDDATEWLRDRDVPIAETFHVMKETHDQVCLLDTAFETLTEEDRAEFVLRFC